MTLATQHPHHTTLGPGQTALIRDKTLVTTVLGSCVAVTMFHRARQLAAICHAMLPCRFCSGACSVESGHHRFLCHAVPGMLAFFHAAGVDNDAIEVKLFGGGTLLRRSSGSREFESVGESNIALAKQLIENLGLRVSAFNVGGNLGRKIIFDTGTGDVRHKHLAKNSLTP